MKSHVIKNPLTKLSLYFLTFYSMYTCDVYLESIGIFSFHNQTLLVIVGLLRRLLIWDVPIFLMVQNPLDYLKLKKNVFKNIMIGCSLGLIMCIMKIVWLYIMHGSVHINFMLNQHLWIDVILLVGLSEEVVFRGFILQQMQALTTFWIANCITIFLFIVTHFPYWILIQKYSMIQILYSSVSMVWIVLFLGFIFKKTESLWPCIVLHSWNNFISEAVK